MSALIVEPTPIPDIYADGFAYVERLGCCFRVAYFTWSNTGPHPEKIVVAKLVRPLSSLTATGQLARMLEVAPILGESKMIGAARGH